LFDRRGPFAALGTLLDVLFERPPRKPSLIAVDPQENESSDSPTRHGRLLRSTLGNGAPGSPC